MAGMT